MSIISSPTSADTFWKETGQTMLGTAAQTLGTLSDGVQSHINGWTSSGGVSGQELISQAGVLTGQTIQQGYNIYQGINSLATREWDGDAISAAGTALWEAGSSVGKKYLQEKWYRLQNLWNSKQKIKIGSLIGEVAPYSSDFSAAAKALGQKFQNLIAYLLDLDVQFKSGTSWSEAGSELGKALVTQASNELSSDPDTAAALQQFTALAGLPEIMKTADQVYRLVKTILKWVDLLKPMKELVADLALTYWSGGMTAAKAVDEIQAIAGKLIVACGKAALEILRKYIYNLELELPGLLVQSVKVLSVREAVKTADKEGLLYNFFFNTSPSQADQALRKWRSWMDTISRENGSNNVWLYTQTFMAVAQDSLTRWQEENTLARRTGNWNNLIAGNPGYQALADLMNNDRAATEYLRIFSNNFTQAYMRGAVINARRVAGLADPPLSATSDVPDDTDGSEPVSQSAETTLASVLDSMASAELVWTEDLILRTSKQVYDKI